MKTRMVKGSPEYIVTDAQGNVVAKAHQVHANGTYTVVLRGRWAGAAPEAKVVAKLREIDAAL